MAGIWEGGCALTTLAHNCGLLLASNMAIPFPTRRDGACGIERDAG